MWRFRGTDVAAARALVEAAFDAGVTLFDTADIYGPDNDEDFGAAEALLAVAEAVGRPRLAGGAAHPEETELLASWLWSRDTRLIAVSGEVPVALPRRSAARFRVPGPQCGGEAACQADGGT